MVLNLRSNNDVFKGEFVDSAYAAKNIKPGARVSVFKNEIDDRSVFNKITGKTIGEFSIKFLKSKIRK